MIRVRMNFSFEMDNTRSWATLPLFASPQARVAVLVGMDRLEHMAHLADLAGRHMAEDVPIKMNHAALPPSVRQILRGTFHQTAAGIGDDELHAHEAAIDQVA